MTDDPKRRAESTYNAAADFFDAVPLAFWERIGRRTVERMSLKRGAHVFDACCGSGASAIPAAHAVGPGGRVLGVDLAENLLQLARAKAQRQGVTHAEFRRADIESFDPSTQMFDAVICVFGIFFLPDMPAAVRGLWRLVRPGGQLAITTWGPRFAEPGSTAFWDAIRRERPDLYKSFNPWDAVTDPLSLAAVMREGGAPADEVVAEAGIQPLSSVDDFWTIALGSGYRGTIEQLDRNAAERVRDETLRRLAELNVTGVETNALFAIARKP